MMLQEVMPKNWKTPYFFLEEFFQKFHNLDIP